MRERISERKEGVDCSSRRCQRPSGRSLSRSERLVVNGNGCLAEGEDSELQA